METREGHLPGKDAPSNFSKLDLELTRDFGLPRTLSGFSMERTRRIKTTMSIEKAICKKRWVD
jgi:hypothetical protein